MRKKLTLTALFVAGIILLFCGTSLADICEKKGLPPGCVEAVDIGGNAVFSTNIKNNQVKSVDILDGQVRTADLAENAVTAIKIKKGAVRSKQILDGQVKAVDLANGVVTAEKLSPEVLAAIEMLKDKIDDLEDLLQHFTRNGNDIYIEGANLHVQNGTGTTYGDPNGLGNLIVGYNEERFIGNDRSGSHNIVVGSKHNFTSFGGFVAGSDNTISGEYASVSDGLDNVASGLGSSVSGGSYNDASGNNTTVVGDSGRVFLDKGTPIH